MATIRTAIELEDHFSNILNNIVSAVNMTVSVMTEMQETVNSPIEPAVFEGLRDYANQATIAVQEMDAILQNMAPPDISTPALAQPEPLTALIQWQADPMPVFTNTGIERFYDELHIANSQLDSLYASQTEIAEQAVQTGIFQPNAAQDLYDIAHRINAIQMQITNIDNNPAGLNFDMANSELERMRAQLGQAVQEQQILNNAVAGMDVQAANSAYLQLSQTVSNTERQIRDSLHMQATWQWQVDEMPVFVGSGIERFRQELESANSRLNMLYNTQAQIAAAASNIDWLPDSALADLGNMQNRLQGIWQQVNLIGSNSLNLGSDFANQELERMRGQLALAVQEQERLNAAVGNMDVQAVNAAYLQLSQTVGDLEGYIRDNTDAQGNFNDAIEDGINSADSLHNIISNAVGAFLGVATVRKTFDFLTDCTQAFDTQLNAETQLMSVLANMLEDDYTAHLAIETSADIGGLNFIQNGINEMVVPVYAETSALDAAFAQITDKAAAIQSRGIYSDEVMIAAAEFSTYFSDPDAVGMMMDTLANYSMGMENGVSEVDTATMVNYATNLGKITGGAYDAMSEKGFVFSDVQRAIIDGTASQSQVTAQLGAEYANMSADMQAAAAITQVIDEYWAGLYDTMSATPEGQIVQMLHTWGKMQEVIGGQLYPYVLLFVDTINANWPTIATIVQGITSGLQFMLGVLNWLLQAAIAVGGGIAENWDLLAPIIYGVTGALAVYGAALMINKGLELASTAAKIGQYLATYAQATATGVAVSATVAETAAQQGLNTAILSCPVFWIVAGIVALVAVFYLAIAAINHFAGTSISATGLICGAIAAAGAFIGNIFMAGLELILGVFATLYNTFAMVANFFGNVFNDPVAAVAHLFFDLVDNVLSMLQTLASAIDTIFGGGLADKVQGWRDNLSVWVDDKFGAQVEIMGQFNTADFLSDYRFGYADAFNAGYNWGDNLNLFGVQELDMSAYDMLNKGNWNNMDSSLQEIAANTGNMAHELSMTDEDLKYLRDIAERETVNRFTTAEIVVNMGGITNQVNKLDDLDGIITHLVDGVNEAVEIAAEGVHM